MQSTVFKVLHSFFKHVLWQPHWKEKYNMWQKNSKLDLKLQVTKEYQKKFENLKGAMAS